MIEAAIIANLLLIGAVQIGDTSVAALIAAIASILNAFILLRVRGVQNTVKAEVLTITSDQESRNAYVIAQRDLQRERMTQIHSLERVADRLEVALSDMGELERRVKLALKTALAERAEESPHSRSTDS